MTPCATCWKATTKKPETPAPASQMRSDKIDLLRALGLALIILAHVEPPTWLFNLRNFDVPLMVLLSGASFALSWRGESYPGYLWKRIKRLLLPVWLFLSLYFSLNALSGEAIETLSSATILASYELLEGIGYVWIIRVFLLVAIIAPFIYQLHRRLPRQRQWALLLATCWAGYEGLRQLPVGQEGLSGLLYHQLLLYLLPYGLLFALGLRLPQMQGRQPLAGAALMALALLSCGGLLWLQLGELPATQAYKYPPSLYYLSYALLLSLLLWSLPERYWQRISRSRLGPPLLFAARNSIWVYLWHILAVKLLVGSPGWSGIPLYLTVVTSAMLVTLLQVWLVTKVVVPRLTNERFRRNLVTVLTG